VNIPFYQYFVPNGTIEKTNQKMDYVHIPFTNISFLTERSKTNQKKETIRKLTNTK
jgi:hypothetical protein